MSLIDREAGLASDNIYGVSLDAAGRIWLGSLGGGVQVVEAGRIGLFDARDGLPGANTWAVIAAPDGTVYAGTYAPGLWTMAPGSDRFAAADLPPRLAEATIRALTFGPRGRLWVGGSSGVWMRGRDGWQPQWSDETATVLAIRHARDGSQWYGTTLGLWPRRGPGHHPVAVDELASAEIRDVYEDRAGTIWASSQGSGLFRLDVGSEPFRVTRLGRNEGLPSNSPHATVEDSRGDLWVNSNQGVFRIDRADLERFLDGRSTSLAPLVLTQADGLRELEGNGGVQPASAVDDRGQILFPTQGGLVSIDPDRLVPRNRPPVAVIDGLLADGHEQKRREHDLGAAVALPLGHRSVQLRFAAADLHGGGSRFRYRLLPAGGRSRADSKPDPLSWTDAIGQHAASYPALAPGRYRFEIVAGNSEGLWGEQATTLEFLVPPHWYETLTFRVGLVVAALLGLALLIQFRMQRLRRRAVELDRQVALRTRQLAAEKSRAELTLAHLADAHESLEESHTQVAQRNRKLAAQSDRLVALDQFRKQLLADVSHELRTPLMLIELPLGELDELAGHRRPGARRRRGRRLRARQRHLLQPDRGAGDELYLRGRLHPVGHRCPRRPGEHPFQRAVQPGYGGPRR